MDIIVDAAISQEKFAVESTDEVFRKIIGMHTAPTPPHNSYNNGMNGNKALSARRPSVPRTPNPERRYIGEIIFGDLARDTAAGFFLALLSNVQSFKERYPAMREWTIKGQIGVEHILIQSFLLWVLDCIGGGRYNGKNRRNNKRSLDAEVAKEKSEMGKDSPMDSGLQISPNNEKTDVVSKISGRVPISKVQKMKIIRKLIRINFPPQIRIWPLAFEALNISGKLLDSFVDAVGDISLSGEISFSTLCHCLSTPSVNRFLGTPNFIVQAVLLGPLKGAAVEAFLATRSSEFRDEAKKLLLEVETWPKSQKKFRDGVIKFAHKTFQDESVPAFSFFISNVLTLMRELRHDYQANNVINISYAYSTIKRSASKTYGDKSLLMEQLDDVFHSIICQHPNIKHFIVQMLKNDYKDERAAQKWQKFSGQYNSRTGMGNNFERVSYHEAPVVGCLAIPSNVEIFIVDTVNKLKILDNEITNCENSDFAVIGLDSEWNPYLSPSRACLLQIALFDSVYLVDLDALRSHSFLVQVLDKLFFSKKALKIGFQFTDDMAALREGISNCASLYKPESLICIGKLITQLLVHSKGVPNFPIDNYFPPVPGEEECGAVLVNDEDDVKQQQNEHSECNVSGDLSTEELYEKSNHDGSNELVVSLRNVGLSVICHRMLGTPLEKSEQCSIWDRRPLRSRQIRYAALDAWCILALYRRCRSWAEALQLDVKELGKAQGKIRCGYPLFWKS